MSGFLDSKTAGGEVDHIDSPDYHEKGGVSHNNVMDDALANAYDGENREHSMGVWEAVKLHPMACFWAFLFCFTIVRFFQQLLRNLRANDNEVMESFDMFLNGNFVALTAFKKRYGVYHNGEYTIETKWQSALFQAGQCGALVGVFLAGPITNRLGYRWTTIVGLIMMNATIFISFFVSPNGSIRRTMG